MKDSTSRRTISRALTGRVLRRRPTIPGKRRSGREISFLSARRLMERGDVPGWVMVTLMTAGLMIAIWAMAGGALTSVFQTAIDRVLAF